MAFHPLAVSVSPEAAGDIAAFHAANAAQAHAKTDNAPTEKSVPLANDSRIFIN